jgi:hypothetical protein
MGCEAHAWLKAEFGAWAWRCERWGVKMETWAWNNASADG